jgi:hypothetical protein
MLCCSQQVIDHRGSNLMFIMKKKIQRFGVHESSLHYEVPSAIIVQVAVSY